jgi:hypothetical protein
MADAVSTFDSNSPLAKLQSMLVWIRERPQNYCPTIGEVDSVLYFLHSTWAKFTDRDEELKTAIQANLRDDELLDGTRRVKFISTRGDNVEEIRNNLRELEPIQNFWRRVDEALGIREVADHW